MSRGGSEKSLFLDISPPAGERKKKAEGHLWEKGFGDISSSQEKQADR